jgi:hypothetical protein
VTQSTKLLAASVDFDLVGVVYIFTIKRSSEFYQLFHALKAPLAKETISSS